MTPCTKTHATFPARAAADRPPGKSISKGTVHGTSFPQAFPQDLRRELRRRNHGRAQFGSIARVAAAADAPSTGEHDGPYVLRHVLLALRRHRARPRRKTVEIRRQSTRSALEGRLCPRGTGAVGAYYDPDRLQKPLIRRGPRGKEEWTAVTGTRRSRTLPKDAEDQGGTWPGSAGRIHARHRPGDVPARAEVVGRDQLRRLVVRAMPRTARRRLHADVRQRRRLARADRHREHRMPRADRHAPRRKHAQHAGAGVRAGHRAEGPHHRRRPALFGRREQGKILAADQARHRPRAAPRLDERARHRGPLRQGFVEKYGHGFDKFAAEIAPYTPEWAAPETGIERR